MAFVGDRVGETIMEDLPNLKIEIENDMDRKMETDDDDASSVGKAATDSSETEEGELVDDDDRLGQQNIRKSNSVQPLSSLNVPTGRSILKYDTKEYLQLQHQTTVKNPNGAFVTGVNIFSPEEQAKLDKRALRFGIEASEAKVLTEKLLKKLYKSMCVKPTDENIRVEALHMRGTEQMTTEDVFTYFKDYGPASLEWITDNSCNVVWLDDISAARALLGLSLHISGQTAPTTSPTRPLCRDSLSDSDVEMESQAVQITTEEPVDDTDCLSEESDAVALDELGIELPPGRWRRGAPHPLSPCILLRFATTSDRSLPRPGYAKIGSHTFGGYVGLISESRKRRMQNALPPPIMFDDVGDEIIPKPSMDDTDNANPWGMLAKTWSQFDKVRKPRPPSPIIERILPIPSRMTPPPSPPTFSSSRVKLVPRTRLRREREAVARKVSEPEDSSDNEGWCSRSKMPRMRMHADDEEKKLEKRLKRSHRHRSHSASPPKRNDLRHRIGTQKTYSEMEGVVEPDPEPETLEPEEEDEVPDLRVAVAADRSPSPKDSKLGIRQSLFTTGNVKSVLRGARGYSENDDDDEDEESETERVKSTVRRHRSRSKERRKHRKHKKDSSHHKSRKRDSDSDSYENTSKAVRSAIRKKSPARKERRSPESKEKRRSPVESSERRSPDERRNPRHERRRKDEVSRKSDSRSSRRRGVESRSSRDLRAKLAHRQKTSDLNNEFRSKSPLQIEIDNDEYYRVIESD